jgi:sialic acid synthase SpsE
MSNDTCHINIAGRLIGSGESPYVIAELSANHNGNIETAMRIIEEAKKAGADAVKLQTYTADTITLNSDAEDFQIKHMGYRIELLEIELVALSMCEVKNACILYNNALKQIIMVYESDQELSDTSIRLKLSSKLPKYMLPTKIKKVGLIPRNSNGKIDRQKLLLEFL